MTPTRRVIQEGQVRNFQTCRGREKTNEQRAAEYGFALRVEAAEAEKRKAAGTSNLKRGEMLPVTQSFESPGKGGENAKTGDKNAGESSRRAAAEVGWSGPTEHFKQGEKLPVSQTFDSRGKHGENSQNDKPKARREGGGQG